jgi:hypothetical protein
MPVANPDLPVRKRTKVFGRAYLKDPVGVAEPAYQYRDREQVVVPSSLDQPSRELLLRAQKASAVTGRAWSRATRRRRTAARAGQRTDQRTWHAGIAANVPRGEPGTTLTPPRPAGRLVLARIR